VLSRRAWKPLPEMVDELVAPPLPPPSRGAARVGWSVYGIVEAPGPVLPDGVLGVDGRHEPLTIVERDLAALTSEVPLAEFGEETLSEVLDDIGWLEAKARAHERVLEAAWAQTPIVPLPMFTVLRAESQVCEMLAGACCAPEL
jgi:hypothetical protein